VEVVPVQLSSRKAQRVSHVSTKRAVDASAAPWLIGDPTTEPMHDAVFDDSLFDTHDVGDDFTLMMEGPSGSMPSFDGLDGIGSSSATLAQFTAISTGACPPASSAATSGASGTPVTCDPFHVSKPTLQVKVLNTPVWSVGSTSAAQLAITSVPALTISRPTGTSSTGCLTPSPQYKGSGSDLPQTPISEAAAVLASSHSNRGSCRAAAVSDTDSCTNSDSSSDADTAPSAVNPTWHALFFHQCECGCWNPTNTARKTMGCLLGVLPGLARALTITQLHTHVQSEFRGLPLSRGSTTLPHGDAPSSDKCDCGCDAGRTWSLLLPSGKPLRPSEDKTLMDVIAASGGDMVSVLRIHLCTPTPSTSMARTAISTAQSLAAH
jgi:hypothetical protein